MKEADRQTDTPQGRLQRTSGRSVRSRNDSERLVCCGAAVLRELTFIERGRKRTVVLRSETRGQKCSSSFYLKGGNNVSLPNNRAWTDSRSLLAAHPHTVQYLTICSSTSNITSNYSPNPLKLEPNKCSSPPPPPPQTPYSLVPLSIAVNSVLKWGAENMILDRRRKRCFSYGKA